VIPAKEQFLEAQARRDEILDRDPSATKVRRDQAMGLFNLASLHQLFTPRDLAAAEASLQNAIRLFEEVLHDDPTDLMNQYYLVLCYRLLGDVESETGDGSAAKQSYQDALTRLETLVHDNPAVLAYRAEMARVHMNVGLLHNEEGNQPEALAALTRALRLLEQVDAQCPDTPDYERNLAITLYAVAVLELGQSKHVAAGEHFEQAKVQFDKLHAKFPKEQGFTQSLDEIMEYLDEIMDYLDASQKPAL
jgi:tetratricopeptide (TPR) repeat protein